MRHPSAYLNWYIGVPKVKFDLKSSGLTNLKINVDLGQIDLSVNYDHGGNPETVRLLAERYRVKPENIFVTCEGTSGTNARILRFIAERNPQKNEAIIEYPTYEPLLRLAQEYFPTVKRFERKPKNNYSLDVESIRASITGKTGIVILTNPHAPSAAIADKRKIKELSNLANEHDFYLMCDEIYAEFNREAVPTIFSLNSEKSTVTTSFTKAYGLGGLKLGIAILNEQLVKELYQDVLNTIGNSSNIVQIVANQLLKNFDKLEDYSRTWLEAKTAAERWLNDNNMCYFPNISGVTYWITTSIPDTNKWINEMTIPRHSLAMVPGAHFLFTNDYEVAKSNMIRIGLGALTPTEQNITAALDTLQDALREH